MKKGLLLIIGMLLVAGCATGNGTQTGMDMAQSGFLGDNYAKLQPGPKDGAKLRWIDPNADWRQYDKVMLDSVVFFFDDASEYEGIEPNELKALADDFNQKFLEALMTKYTIVAEPGPGVLRIRFAITDLEQSNPGMATITSVVPVGLVVSTLNKGATDSWTGSGATSAEMMILDAQTNTVIAVAKDEKTAGFTERFSKWGSAEEAFTYWADRLVQFLVNARAPQ